MKHKGSGWFGHKELHRKAAYKGLGLSRDYATKAKHIRKPSQPTWLGDVYGSRI
jgi:hypothetical protein